MVLSDLLMCVNVTGQNYIEVKIFKPRLIVNFLFMRLGLGDKGNSELT